MTEIPEKYVHKRGINMRRDVQRALDRNNMEELAEALSPIQLQFCQEYVKDFNASRAIQRSDSTTVHPEKFGYQLINHVGCKRYIQHLLEARTAQMKIDQGFVIQKLLNALEKAENTNNQQVAVRTLELLAKHLGMLTDKQEITGKDGGAIQYEKLKQDADDFTRSITKLINRGRTAEVSGDTES